MKISFKSLHRDLGYFYIGLIITFSISGIFMNHRAIRYPLNYEYESYNITISKRLLSKEISDKTIRKIINKLGINDQLRAYNVDNNILWISFKNVEVTINTLSWK